MRVIIIQPEKEPEFKDLKDDGFLSKEITDDPSHYTIGSNLGLICDDHAIVKQLPPNRYWGRFNQNIRGPLLIYRYNEVGETIDILDSDMDLVKRILPPYKPGLPDPITYDDNPEEAVRRYIKVYER